MLSQYKQATIFLSTGQSGEEICTCQKEKGKTRNNDWRQECEFYL